MCCATHNRYFAGQKFGATLGSSLVGGARPPPYPSWSHSGLQIVGFKVTCDHGALTVPCTVNVCHYPCRVCELQHKKEMRISVLVQCSWHRSALFELVASYLFSLGSETKIMLELTCFLLITFIHLLLYYGTVMYLLIFFGINIILNKQAIDTASVFIHWWVSTEYRHQTQPPEDQPFLGTSEENPSISAGPSDIYG